jgi:hypothetical protein
LWLPAICKYLILLDAQRAKMPHQSFSDSLYFNQKSSPFSPTPTGGIMLPKTENGD